jgi:Flp pilus assembly protein TadD
MEEWLRTHSQTKGIYLIMSGYGNVLSQLEMYTQAEEEFRRVLDLRKSYVPARVGLAWACYYQGKKKEAYAELKQSQKLVESGNEYTSEKLLVHLERYRMLEDIKG